ncbi:MAG: hypothetical protein ACYSSI_00250 [Planctomycetota bacterium]|jgi:hypothetical protein
MPGRYEEYWGHRIWVPEEPDDEQEPINSDEAYDNKVDEKLIRESEE